MSRKLKIIFTLSLLLNIVLIAAGVGLYHKHAQRWHGKDIRAELSEETRALMRQNFQKKRQEMKPVYDELRQSKKEIANILKAETFDVEAYDQATQDLLDLKDKLSRKKAESAKGFLNEISAEDRKAMAERMAERLAGHGKGRKHKKHDRERPVKESRD